MQTLQTNPDRRLTADMSLQRYGLSDATSFFQQLSGKPYVGNVVISPHIYPPTVSFATSVSSIAWPQYSLKPKTQNLKPKHVWAMWSSAPTLTLPQSPLPQR